MLYFTFISCCESRLSLIDLFGWTVCFFVVENQLHDLQFDFKKKHSTADSTFVCSKCCSTSAHRDPIIRAWSVTADA